MVERPYTLTTIPPRRAKARPIRISITAPDLDVAVFRAKRAGFNVVEPKK